MLFTSISFLYYFLPVVLLSYFLVPRKLKNTVLLLASMLFYFYGEPKYLFLMWLEIGVAYGGAILLDKNRSKALLYIILAIHIGLLIIFKYTDFFIQNVNAIFKTDIALLHIALPVGISFYTFQIISYVVDVYKGKVKVQKNIGKLATYVSLFPQLIAGPIVRYETIAEELDGREHSWDNLAMGIRRFTIGLAKKVLLANILGELCANFGLVTERSIVFYWLAAIIYMLQVYFDFAGYSDMAIGLGRMFGFHFLENFDYPYMARSITEFWRRWHISLGSWFRDYVYIPLGGNRHGKLILLRNILIVWFLTGFWHGASWNFVIWGLFFGILLLVEKLWLGKYLEKWPRFLQSLYVLFIVMISFIIFGADNMSEAFNNITGLFGLNGESFINDYTIYNLKSYAVVLIVALVAATPCFKMILEKLRKKEFINKTLNILEPLLMVVLLLIVTAYLIDNSYNPFLYFRF